MNIAVISNQETQSGMSSFILMLASVFARTQRRRVAVMSTGDINEMFDVVEMKETASPIKSVNVYQSMILSSAIQDDEVWDYGFRIGEEEVFGFDIKLDSISSEQQVRVYEETLNRIKAPMKLIEVVGSLDDPLNKSIIDKSNIILYVFNHNKKSMGKVKDYVKNGDILWLNRTGYICLKYDKNVIAEKAIANEIGANVTRVMQVPYNSCIPKEALAGTLNTLAKFIAKGHSEVINLRPKFLEIMRFIYTGQGKKLIKGENEWAQ